MTRAPRTARVQHGRLAFVRTGSTRFDVTDPYSFAIGLSWGGFALLFAALELTINAGFGALYWARPGCVVNLPADSFLYAVFFSVETLATVGYGVMAPATVYGHLVSGIEIIFGTAFTAIMTGLTFVRFSRPRARILYAENAVVARHNGVPTLMLRIANARAGMMTNALVRLAVLLPETTAEGASIRRTHDLLLVRANSPLFAITWIVMHKIEPDSPLFGMTPERLREDRARLFVTIEAWDVKLGAEVRDLHDYGPEEILFGMRFVDAVSVNDAGIPVADFSRLSDVTTDSGEPESA